MLTIHKAEKKKGRLRLGISGVSGSGKTYGALQLAFGIGGKVGVIDTENGSAELYADLGDYDVITLTPPYTPERYIEALRAFEEANYDVVIIDSMTHEWNGAGGCLEMVDQIAKAKYRGNGWAGWNDVTPRHRKFLDAILSSPCHIIGTMRSKTETAQEDVDGRKKVVKLGMKSEQRDGMEYEFTIMFDVVPDGNLASATKDRSRLFQNHGFFKITPDIGREIKEWLETGKDEKEDLIEIALAKIEESTGKKPTEATRTFFEKMSISKIEEHIRKTQEDISRKMVDEAKAEVGE
jgi:hypothetical protein